ncbi:hypothetical protein NL676_036916 [Syzygium grande]|nr:hypothetical protein NL676_036916 [Syzygium grande]
MRRPDAADERAVVAAGAGNMLYNSSLRESLLRPANCWPFSSFVFLPVVLLSARWSRCQNFRGRLGWREQWGCALMTTLGRLGRTERPLRNQSSRLEKREGRAFSTSGSDDRTAGLVCVVRTGGLRHLSGLRLLRPIAGRSGQARLWLTLMTQFSRRIFTEEHNGSAAGDFEHDHAHHGCATEAGTGVITWAGMKKRCSAQWTRDSIRSPMNDWVLFAWLVVRSGAASVNWRWFWSRCETDISALSGWNLGRELGLVPMPTPILSR